MVLDCDMMCVLFVPHTRSLASSAVLADVVVSVWPVRIALYFLMFLSALLQLSLNPNGFFLIQSVLVSSKVLGWTGTSWFLIFFPLLAVLSLSLFLLALVDLAALLVKLLSLLSPTLRRYFQSTWYEFMGHNPSITALVARSVLLLHFLVIPLAAFIFFVAATLQGSAVAPASWVLVVCFCWFQVSYFVTVTHLYFLRRYSWAKFSHVWRRR